MSVSLCPSVFALLLRRLKIDKSKTFPQEVYFLPCIIVLWKFMHFWTSSHTLTTTRFHQWLMNTAVACFAITFHFQTSFIVLSVELNRKIVMTGDLPGLRMVCVFDSSLFNGTPSLRIFARTGWGKSRNIVVRVTSNSADITVLFTIEIGCLITGGGGCFLPTACLQTGSVGHRAFSVRK